jgi:hypothetical protein
VADLVAQSLVPPKVPFSVTRGVAAEPERLVALHASGMLHDEEFRAAKARIIHSG